MECETSIDRGIIMDHGDHRVGECTPKKHSSDFKFMVGTSAKKSKELSKKRSKEVLMGSSWELRQQKRAEEHINLESLNIPRLCEHERDLE